MKKLICVVAACFFSSLAFADEASIQKVLDAVHEKGFWGCDDKIRDSYSHSVVRYVEAKVPFATFEKDARGASKKKVINDEIIVIVDLVGHREYDWIGGASSTIFRKIGKQCLGAENFSTLSSIRRDCNAMAKFIGQTTLVAEEGDSFWVRHEGDFFKWGGAETLLTPLDGGGCRQLSLPQDMSVPQN